MSDLCKPRIFDGEIIENVVWELPSGPEDRVVAQLTHGVWEIPATMFTNMGHTDLSEGTKFQVETAPAGMVPKNIKVLPPLEDLQ